VSEHRFVMKCWERDELAQMLARHGFGKTSYFGAYAPGIEVGTTDRIVAVALRTE
jgi:hypothetical protein